MDGADGGALRRGAVTRNVAQWATCAPDSHERSGTDGGGLT